MAQDKLLDVEIVTPKKVVFEGKAISVSVSGVKSPFQVLNNHAPILSTLDIGITKIVDDSEKAIIFATGSGFTEVHKNKVSILVESADNASEINSEDIKIELENAREQLKSDKSEKTILAVSGAENKLKAIEKIKENN